MGPSASQILPDVIRERVALSIRGEVQDVGFRLFVFRLAQDLDLTGSIANSPEGAFIEIEGSSDLLEVFRSPARNSLPA